MLFLAVDLVLLFGAVVDLAPVPSALLGDLSMEAVPRLGEGKGLLFSSFFVPLTLNFAMEYRKMN